MRNSVFQIHKNPLFIKSARIRLRKNDFLKRAIPITIVYLFLFLLMSTTSLAPPNNSVIGIVIIFVMQSFFLLVGGTNAIIQGIYHEKENGLLDYQRLTPMSAVEKVLGYLFGLPIREYAFTALGLPFVVLLALFEGVSLVSLGKLYIALFSLGMTYHLAGMVSGITRKESPSKRRRSGGATVVLMHFIIPILAGFGFVILGFFTVWPPLIEFIFSALGISDFIREYIYWKSALFFHQEISSTLYLVLINVFLLTGCFIAMMRKWEFQDNHALSKKHALWLYGIVQILLVGSIFPRAMYMQQWSEFFSVEADIAIVSSATIVFFILSMVIISFLIDIITPSKNALLSGFRRAKIQNQSALNVWDDWAVSTPTVMILTGLTCFAYGWLVYLILDGDMQELAIQACLPLILFAAVAILLQALRQLFEEKGAKLVRFLVGYLPLLIIVFIGSSNGYSTELWYIGVISPLGSIPAVTAYAFGLQQMQSIAFAAIAIQVSLAGFFWYRMQLLIKDYQLTVSDK